MTIEPNWIKMRSELGRDPRVFELANLVGVSRTSVVGSLQFVWAFADYGTADGRLKGVTESDIDAVAEQPGFAAAMIKVGWLRKYKQGMELPDFGKHMGESAKKRMQNTARQQSSRSRRAESATEARQKRDTGATEARQERDQRERERERREEGARLTTPGAQGEIKRSPTPGACAKSPATRADREAATATKDRSTKTKPGRYDYPPEFETWWAVYPKRVGKPDALKAWRLVTREGADPDVITEAGRAMEAAWREHADRLQFCPGPGRWLRERRFEDDPGTYAMTASEPTRNGRYLTPAEQADIRRADERARTYGRGTDELPII